MSAFDIVCKCSAHDDLKNFVLLPQIPALEKGIKKAQEELAKIAKAEQGAQEMTAPPESIMAEHARGGKALIQQRA